jgi:hypothetical protein
MREEGMSGKGRGFFFCGHVRVCGRKDKIPSFGKGCSRAVEKKEDDELDMH